MKTLDAKLAAIHADPAGAPDFILADAKDADMAYGLASPGRSPEYHGPEARFRTLADPNRNRPCRGSRPRRKSARYGPPPAASA